MIAVQLFQRIGQTIEKRIHHFFLKVYVLFTIVSLLTPGVAVSDSINIGQYAGNTDSSSFGAYKKNYILPVTWAEPLDDRLEKEIKFQISVKQTAFTVQGFELYLAYTQKSFWQAYDLSDSRPFRETNYNPELFVRSPNYKTKFGRLNGDFGLEHESNGMREPYSRSWNRVYFRFGYCYNFFVTQYKIWYRLPESEKKYAGDPEGDENPDIHKYYGYGELRISLNFEKTQLAFLGRLNTVEKKGALEVDISYPLPGDSMFGYIHYWNGYGESLIDYNRYITKVGIGLLFVR